MKKILILLAAFSTAVWADCNIKTASTLETKRSISAVTDLEKDKSVYGQCTVKYRIQIDGIWHTVDWTTKGLEQQDSLCRQAIDNGRADLLQTLGGNFQAESVTVCTDGQKLNRKIKIGDSILENEVGRVSEVNAKYFKHKNSKCRLFRERYNDRGQLQVYHGVICQTDDENWTVVDKW